MARTLPRRTEPVMPGVAHLVWRWYRDSMRSKKSWPEGEAVVTWLLLLAPARKGMAGGVGWKRCMWDDESRLARLHEVEFRERRRNTRSAKLAARALSPSAQALSLGRIPSPRLHLLPRRIHSRASHRLDGWIDGDRPCRPHPLYRRLG